VSREAATVHNGVVLTSERDDDAMVYGAAATEVARPAGPAAAEVVGNRGPGYARLWVGASDADSEAVGS
jgi:hypothetical protein